MGEDRTEESADAGRRRDRGVQLVRRMWLPRTLGLALGAVAIGTVLSANDAPAAYWVALFLSCFVWPHVALAFGTRSSQPYQAELRSLTVDSAIGGAWIALMHFNLLPSVIIAVMLSMDKIAVGGLDFLARCALAMLGAAAACALVFGFEVRLDTSSTEMLGSLPLLIAYPVAVGFTTYGLARRVREQNRMLRALSRTDGLSRLLNRNAWEELVSAEFQRCRRSGRVATLLMLDIDHFKRINDEHGHLCGDEVIRNVAALLRDSLREQDVPGRYGGEEFGVILPETDAEGGYVIAERIRTRIDRALLHAAAGVRGTVSVGIAELGPGEAGYTDWIAHADRALYAAKAAGRNRSERYSSL